MNPEVRLSLADGTLTLRPIHDRALRVLFTPGELSPEIPSVTLVSPQTPAYTCHEENDAVTLQTAGLKTVFHRPTASLEFFDTAGKSLLREQPGTRRLTPGVIQGEPCFCAEQTFATHPREHLHGLGQFQDGHFNLHGVTRRLLQVNTQIALPFILSSGGYGLLWHQPGLTDFNPADHPVILEKDPAEGPEFCFTVTGSTGVFTEKGRVQFYRGRLEIPADGNYVLFLDYGEMTNRHSLRVDGTLLIDHENFWLPPSVDAHVSLAAGIHEIEISSTKGAPRLSWRAQASTTTFRSPHARALDYVVFAGSDAKDILSAFRDVTGPAPLLPKWAYGFWQCRERYATQEELLINAREHRARQLPADVIVQDWQYWPAEQWAGMQFDPARYSDPDGLVRELKALDLKLVISVWENVSPDSSLGKSYAQKGFYIPDSPWIDVFNPAVRAAHWQAMNDHLQKLGISGWWLDATEPENDALAGKKTFSGPGEFHRLAYPLHVSQAVYEGQRASVPDKRVCILSRSAFLGQQRYASIAWSGDIGSDWDAFRRQIVAGLNYSACGLPYWTTDIGGFFRPENQYRDPAYHEVLLRWLQFGAFNPIMRLHGFGTETELWRFGPQVETIAREILRLRYRLLPYIYSLAWQVASAGETFLRPLMMDFPRDPAAWKERYQFMFGSAFLVHPVTDTAFSPLETYLPGGVRWFDFWTGAHHSGGRHLETARALERIPLFIRAGSIVPLGPDLQHTAQLPADPIELRIYPGADGAFTLYEDSGDSYAYEQGDYLTIPMKWIDPTRTLVLESAQGRWAAQPFTRTFHITLVRENHGIGTTATPDPDVIAIYRGTELAIPLH